MWQPGWEGSLGGEWIHVCTAESLHSSLETIIALLIGSTPIQNECFWCEKKLKKKKKTPLCKTAGVETALLWMPS